MTFKEMGIDSFPLCWPTGWKRSQSHKRSKFVATFGRARDQAIHELKLLGVSDYNVIISSNIPLRRDGLPYANTANPHDPGIAVYFRFKNKPMVLACDQYHLATDNIHAIAKTIEAMRGIQRWGASEMMERSFTGFQALPPPKRNWWEILGVTKEAGQSEIKAAYYKMAEKHHPDRGGSVEIMARINNAYEEACR